MTSDISNAINSLETEPSSDHLCLQLQARQVLFILLILSKRCKRHEKGQNLRKMRAINTTA